LTSTSLRSPRRCVQSSSRYAARFRGLFRRHWRASGTVCPDTSCTESPLLYFAGFKEHYSLFAASGTFFAELEDELKGYDVRKGTVHFPLTKPVPVKLISRISKLRAASIAVTAKNPAVMPDSK
jgi:hypothetical protein